MLIAVDASLLDRMRKGLPREIRDMIYEQLWDEETVERSRIRMSNAIAKQCLGCKPPEKLDCDFHMELPHYVHQSLVGKETA
jgi:hypothetical protein